ncbi:Hypothetical protein CCH01_004240 [Clostridium chauvoei JF4335]|uniref:Uncharacterized protein n=1 Tax=Clostridium chauvoei JF4335 TaxID=1351755 RepID=S6F7Y4_9CLOT|nr:Hypothetical protein CCH01_004240 [Clostridium chauvoei JF4335]SLK14732.1 Hypothetical protein CCH01_07420 [Clostridium chauvoei JF4335]
MGNKDYNSDKKFATFLITTIFLIIVLLVMLLNLLVK